MDVRSRAHRASTGRAGGPRVADLAILSTLVVGAALGWWWSVRMADHMTAMSGGGEMAMRSDDTMSLAAFVVGWVAMMAAMMFLGIAPMVRLYARAAALGRVAPVPFFVAGYMLVWGSMGVPSYFAWRELATPLAEGEPWAGRLAGSVFLIAAAYQVSPFKAACLRHCRSPISFFLHHGGTTIDTPYRATRLGVVHGAFCLGCCWALMAILVAVGTMNLGWMALLTVVIIVEKTLPRGEQLVRVAAVGFALVGAVLLMNPEVIIALT